MGVIVSRLLVVQRWRIVTHFRVYRGSGSSVFEFEFRFGKPPKPVPVEELLDDDDDYAVMAMDAGS